MTTTLDDSNQSQSNSANYCVDFDDYCDGTVDKLDILRDWKRAYPALKVTLFAIPARCSAETIAAAKDLGDWVQLAPHGWRHTKGECLAWSDDEAEARIVEAARRGIDARVFRAPAWLLDGDTYEACKRLGYVVATHRVFRVANTGAKEYVYNMPHEGVKSVHGHLTPVCGNYIDDKPAQPFPTNAAFIFPQDVAEIIDGVLCTEEEIRCAS